jgi:hypothetical protein
MTKTKQIKKWLAILSVSLLAGCQMSPDDPRIAAVKNQQALPEGSNLGGGFKVGMSPDETCDFFSRHYLVQIKDDELCSRVKKDIDFTNLTIVSDGIFATNNKLQDIHTIAFYFNQDAELFLVTAVEDLFLNFNYLEHEMYKSYFNDRPVRDK